MVDHNRGLTNESIRAFMASLSNWGRWGPNDQVGALNYVTPARRMAAWSEVRDGLVVSLSRPLNTEPGADNRRPALHYMVHTGELAGLTQGEHGFEVASDFLGLHYHGLTTSHIDALSHVFWRGRMYNGYSSAEIREDGAHKNGIEQVRDKLVGRGVLLDIARVRDRPWLNPGEPIYPEDLEEAERRQGVTVGEGDFLLIRTGRFRRVAEEGNDGWFTRGGAGPHASVLPWLHERRIAVIGGDGINDVAPSGFNDFHIPIHMVGIIAMGLHLLDNHDLEALATACAARSQYSFLVMVAPLFLARGTGSPVNSLAVL